MGKNLIPLIAERLNVSIGEEFRLTWKSARPVRYKFVLDKGLMKTEDFGVTWCNASPALYELLLLGQVKIEKIPYEPKVGERYWTYKGDGFEVVCDVWNGYAIDYYRKACGVIFFSKEEASAALTVKYRELTGKELQRE